MTHDHLSHAPPRSNVLRYLVFTKLRMFDIIAVFDIIAEPVVVFQL